MKTLPAVPRIKARLARLGQSANQFARETKIDQSEFHKILNGKRLRVSVEFAAKMEDATEGEVHMRLWIPVEVGDEEARV
jgi:transcriptional regulator with XRE-family HTH domain